MPDILKEIIDIALLVLVIMAGWSICNSLAAIAAALTRLSKQSPPAAYFEEEPTA